MTILEKTSFLWTLNPNLRSREAEMKSVMTILRNENGSIMTVSLIILVLATMIGVAATITASLELQISGNDVRYAENFYRAEAAAMIGARAIEDTPDTNLENRQYLEEGDSGEEVDLPTESNLPDADNISDNRNWESTGNNVYSTEAPSAVSDENDKFEARFLPVEVPARGQPLGIESTSGSKMHEFVIYGRSVREAPDSTKQLGQVIIEVGYKKRF